jgi:4'-phosphopantetheinyl transferase
MASLSLDEVHVWTASRDAPEEAIEALRRLLNDDERRRADRFAFAHDRTRFAVARGLLRVILGQYLDRPPESLGFVANIHGKPALDARSNIDPSIHFNLAHSGPWVVYALTLGREVGVDIERIRPEFGGFAIAERFFAPGEIATLRSLPEGSRSLAFFHGWTRKEAYIKAKGKGLALPLDEFEVAIDPTEPAALLATMPDPLEVRRWSLVEIPADPGFVAALCVEGSGWTLRQGRWPEDSDRADGPFRSVEASL